MKASAGILLYRSVQRTIEVLLVHPGGPFWKNRDLAAWSIPKGEFDISENPLHASPYARIYGTAYGFYSFSGSTIA
ncbi:hypothetical protein SAMN06297358_0648 [Pedobacter xixiisoli]|uniref:Uncharacterized protein n=1 Tax=Pedobacter xixiisoli TaxID=1476464 RepID=A0A285ZRX6_9SPHI|nr:hypothetical protein SAMN06297358_0648 [Pedobacter xixiisoli]